MDIMEKKSKVNEFIESLKGAIFHVTFVKANGDVRVASGKAKVFSALAGGDSTLDNSPAVPYYDLNSKGYRAFRVDRLVKIQSGDKVFE